MTVTYAEMESWTYQELMTWGNPTGGVRFLEVELGAATAHAMLEIGPSADRTQLPEDWDLDDITGDVLLSPGIAYSYGRPDQRSKATPGRLTATLLNDSGTYTPRRTTSPFFPKLKTGFPVRLGVNLDDGAGYIELWSGFASSIVPGWTDASGKVPIATLSAGGVFERLGQGKTPLRSVMTRGISGGTQFTTNPPAVPPAPPFRYWPFEEASGSSAASDYFGGPSIVPSGSVSWGNDTTMSGSDALPTWVTGAGFSVDLSDYTVAAIPQWRVEFVASIPTTHSADTVLFKWTTTGGTAVLWQVVWDEGPGNLIMQAFDASGNELLSDPGSTLDPTVIGTSQLFMVDAVEEFADGVLTGVRWSMFYSVANGGAASGAGSGTLLAGHTLGKLKTGYLTVGAGLTGMVFGHLAAFDTADPFDAIDGIFLVWDYQYTNGYDQETAITRLRRLCAEENIQLSASFAEIVRRMGPQPSDTIENVLAECVVVDTGLLIDGVGFGLKMLPGPGRTNVAQAFTLDVSLNQVATSPSPVEDNTGLRNDVTVNRSRGGTARFAQPTGMPYAVDGADGIGNFDDTVTVNTFSDTPTPGHNALKNYASFLVHLGTVDEDRYASIGLDLAALALAGYASLITTWLAAGPVGARFGLTNLPADSATQNADLFVEDVSALLTPQDWTVDHNCSPASPWDVGLVGTMRVDTPIGGTVTTVDTTNGAASLVVNVLAGHIWSTSSAQYPVDLSVGGVKLTATGCSGGASPQTFTISPTIGQVIPAGSDVQLWTPAIVGMGEVTL